MTERVFAAYTLHDDPGLRLEAAPPTRAWMADTPAGFANRCLPLLMANQAGWLVRNEATVEVRWNGGDARSSLSVQYDHDPPAYAALSHFGCGVVTWNLPWIFRTPSGYDLLVRGPANWPKDGATPLEGLVETDWPPASFTMNWKLTRPGHAVTFADGEPICMLVPQRRTELETFTPRLCTRDDDPALCNDHDTWAAARGAFLRELDDPDSAASARGWQKDYFQGRRGDGSRAPQHRTRLHLAQFLKT
ncbi:MAG TPA: DUF6065 family protein [Streptosporangiaceae bacterium]